jgi:hypothetical protein
MVLSACGGAATPAPATEAPQATTAPATEAPTAAPVTRTGPWVDEVVFSEQGDNAVCIAQLQAGDLDSCADGNTNPDDFKTVQGDSNLSYSTSYGLNFGILFNPIPTFKDGRVNPFGDAKIRESVNMLIDRNYVIQEIFGGLGAAKYSTLVGVFPDYARYIEVARALEAKYAYNPEKAKGIIATEMEGLGGTLNADGKWEIDGKPVTLIFIIRTEDERTPIGDYVANQLETVGFTVDRQYKARSEASPIWLRSDPEEGQWNLYTEGWINTVISRDDGTNFGFYDSDFGGCCGLSSQYMTADVLGQEYYDVATKLWNNEFTNMDERGELFKKAIELSGQLSYHVYIVDTQAFFPQRKELTVAADLAGGVSGSRLWPFTIRLGDQEGGTARLALNDIFIDPWNPVGGSNWISDTMVGRATSDVASMPDPYTGLSWPQRAEALSVTAKEGLPITKNLDWVNLQFQADDIAVPADAWVDWDAANQKFITAGEAADIAAKIAGVDEAVAGAADVTSITDASVSKFVSDYAAAFAEATGAAADVSTAFEGEEAQAGLKAKAEEIAALGSDDEKKAALVDFAKSTIGGDLLAVASHDHSTSLVKITWTYPANLYDTVKWHDGSPISAADFVMNMIMTFDPGKSASGLYDEAYVPGLEAFQASFKGVQIESTDPLVITTYTDSYALDAETFGSSWWPNYGYGPGAWHNLTPAIMAENAGEIAFTTDKAAAKEVEWTNFIDGPTIDIQKKYLDQAMADGFIPFSATLSNYITADEAKARYENLSKWFADHGHFWIGTGPFYLDKVFTTEGNAVLKRNESYPDLADKWSQFSAPKVALTEVSGDGQVVVGQDASFDVTVTYNNEPYPADEISAVKYLVFNSNGDLVASGDAEFVADGQYTVTLGSDITSKFEAGSNKIEVATTSKLVSIPSFASFEFVTVK